jgi:uncharacterized lipoprotein
MPYSRYGRIEERRQERRLVLALVGSILILIGVAIFGLKLLVGFSLLVDRLRGASPKQQSAATILPPVLDALPTATKSATLAISGSGQASLTAIIYDNGQEIKKVSVGNTGTFKVVITNLADGSHTVSAKLTNHQGNLSDLSNIVTVEIKQKQPKLEVTAPGDHVSFSGDANAVAVTGTTDDNTTVTVNGRYAIIKSDNSFSYSYTLSDGENKLTVVAQDEAGNTTTVERTITYQR